MSVTSLSWQNDHFIVKWHRKRRKGASFPHRGTPQRAVEVLEEPGSLSAAVSNRQVAVYNDIRDAGRRAVVSKHRRQPAVSVEEALARPVLPRVTGIAVTQQQTRSELPRIARPDSGVSMTTTAKRNRVVRVVASSGTIVTPLPPAEVFRPLELERQTH